jgi:SAM-dependent methyltransferase
MPSIGREALVPRCNFCRATEFKDYAGRPADQCSGCRSLARHRVALEVYTRNELFTKRPGGVRVLHFAPEACLHDKIGPVVESGYVCSDSRPEMYKKMQCLRLTLPDGLSIFPEGYFDYVIHNHVLEHIHGTFRDHIPPICRILKPGGMTIFSVPGPDPDAPTTIEGGEHLPDDAERVRTFGQADHVRRFGRDLLEFMESLPNGKFSRDDITVQDRAAISVKPGSNRFLIWTKHPEGG